MYDQLKQQVRKLIHTRSSISPKANVLTDRFSQWQSFELDWSVHLRLKQLAEDLVFINVARDMSTLSHCVSRQVGCVIARDGRILSTGINGTSSNDVNCDTLFPLDDFDPVAHRKWSDDNEIHAELNAVNFAAKDGISLNGSTLYCTLQPCMQCSKNLPAVGIKRIVFDTFYDRVDNFSTQAEFLKRKGVIIEKLPSDEEIEKFVATHATRIN